MRFTAACSACPAQTPLQFVFYVDMRESMWAQAKNILIAVGGRAVKPPIEGAEHAMTSDEILEIEEVRGSPACGLGTMCACDRGSSNDAALVAMLIYSYGVCTLCADTTTQPYNLCFAFRLFISDET